MSLPHIASFIHNEIIVIVVAKSSNLILLSICLAVFKFKTVNSVIYIDGNIDTCIWRCEKSPVHRQCIYFLGD